MDVAREAPLLPDPIFTLTALDDVHTLASLLVPRTRPLPEYRSWPPTLLPTTVTLALPVVAPLLTPPELTTHTSVVIARLAEARLSTDVTTIPSLPPTPASLLHCTLVTDIHVLAARLDPPIDTRTL